MGMPKATYSKRCTGKLNGTSESEEDETHMTDSTNDLEVQDSVHLGRLQLLD